MSQRQTSVPGLRRSCRKINMRRDKYVALLQFYREPLTLRSIALTTSPRSLNFHKRAFFRLNPLLRKSESACVPMSSLAQRTLQMSSLPNDPNQRRISTCLFGSCHCVTHGERPCIATTWQGTNPANVANLCQGLSLKMTSFFARGVQTCHHVLAMCASSHNKFELDFGFDSDWPNENHGRGIGLGPMCRRSDRPSPLEAVRTSAQTRSHRKTCSRFSSSGFSSRNPTSVR
jgi:hypothetical protein